MTMDFCANWTVCRKDTPDQVQQVTLPHDAMRTEPRSKCLNGANSGYFPGGRYLYEKDFTLAPEQLGGYIALVFEGVYRNAVVSVNGKELCRHAYGYTEFTVDISEVAQEGANHVTVDVDNSLEPNSRWYSGSGIYRPVHLIIKPKEHIANVQVLTKSIRPPVLSVSADCPADTVVSVWDGDTQVASGPVGDIEVPDGKLWDAEHPNLYRVVLSCAGDQEEVVTGIRELTWNPSVGVRVNGNEVKFRGACIHHDNGFLGAAEFDDAAERRVRILKEAGFNAIRSAHNPCSRAILRAADKLGMYIMDESFDMWYIPKTYHDYSRDFAQNYKEDLAAMVAKDISHPSVVMYSLGNENSELGQERGIDLLKEQAELVRSLDRTRIVTVGANLMLMSQAIYKDDGKPYKAEPMNPEDSKDLMAQLDKQSSTGFNMVMNLLPDMMLNATKGKKNGEKADKLVPYVDVLGLNYGTPRYAEDLERDPGRIYNGSETMVYKIADNWPLVMKYPQLIGDFVWTGWDYLGEAGTCGAWDYTEWGGLGLFDGAGTIDATGYQTACSYYMQIAYGLWKKPYLAVKPVSMAGKQYYHGAWRMTNALHSWSWQGYEGNKTEAEVYGLGDTAELFLNGKSLGKKKMKSNKAIFHVTYKPGTLTAKVYQNGALWGEDTLVTATREVILRAKAERTEMQANGQDLCYIDIELTDSKGELQPGVEKMVTVSVEGEGAELAAVGSARTRTAEVFHNGCHTTHFGRAQAILRASETPGPVKVTVSADGMQPAVLEIQVR